MPIETVGLGLSGAGREDGHGLRKLMPDGFLTELNEAKPGTVAAPVDSARRNLNLSQVSWRANLETLQLQGLKRFVLTLSRVP